MTEKKLTCWICQEYDECPWPICYEYEREVTERIKQEEEAQDMFEEGEE